MKLIVGITRETPDWTMVLKQIGVPFEMVNSYKPIQVDAFTVLIVNHSAEKKSVENILKFLHNGGSVLVEANFVQNLIPQKIKRIYIQKLYAENSTLFLQPVCCDLFKWPQVVRDAKFCEDQKGRYVVGVLTYGKGTVVILPSGFTATLLSNNVKQKFFHSEFGERLPSERVSKVSKGSVRYIVQKILEYLYHCRGFPFVHLWHFPDREENVFIFRVDTDYGTQQEVEDLYTVCKENHIRATWFVETKSQEDWIPFYRNMKNQEIGYHCYRHRLFSTMQANREDLSRGLQILRKAGIHPKGYVAPYGEWHASLGRLLQEQQFEYSSEFQLAYDTLPFFPYLGKDFSQVLQVPIHPVSIGNLRRARYIKNDFISYYQGIINQKLALKEPIFIYHHPVHHCLDVIRAIFGEIRQQGIPSLQMGDYSTWWKRRIQIHWTPEYRDNKLHVNVQNGDASVAIRAILPDKRWAVFPFQEVVPLDNLSWKEPDQPLKKSIPRYQRRDSWRLLVYKMEYLYGKLKS